MMLSSLLEKIVLGRRGAKRQREVESKLIMERENLSSQQREVRAIVRQNEQISNSASRIMQTMTNAMILMEGGSGKPKK